MRVVELREHIRTRINQLADYQMELQETLHRVPIWKVKDHLDEMERVAADLSRLAGWFVEEGGVQTFNRCQKGAGL